MKNYSAIAILLFLAHSAFAFDLVEALPLTERIVMIHIKEGHAVHHQKGQKRDQDEKVILTVLDTAAATKLDAWTITSADDPNFSKDVHPQKIGRKSKGTDFAWMSQGWDAKNNRVVNKDPDHAKDHWLYLHLPQPLVSGKTYSIKVAGIAGIDPLTLAYSVEKSRSEAVHVNLMGYTPDSPAKFGYVYHWAGDEGSTDLSFLKGKTFRLIDQKGGKAAFTGEVAFRAPANRQETGLVKDTPNGSYICAEVWQCDFSAFTTPGEYVLAVDGIGCSFPFKIEADVYREAFRVTCRGLYHNRSGLDLKKPFTEFERPAPHNPLLTPGFAGKLVYTTSRFIDWKNGDADLADKPAIEAGIKGPIDVWGWYQDAGDWDSYSAHTNVASTLCFAYETAPQNFADGELNLPESGNGVPDILDEAAWLPRFCFRLRHELVKKGWGTGGVGLRVCGDHFGGDTKKDGGSKASYEDTDRQWIVSGEDPHSTFRYAAIAAHLAHCMQIAKATDPEKVDWLAEAKEAYAWALKNMQAKDEKSVLEGRCYASAQLFRLTGDAQYETQFEKDVSTMKSEELAFERAFGPWSYALGGKGKPELLQKVRAMVLAKCEDTALVTSEKRALRWGGVFWMPMLVGQQTTPWILEGIVGYTLTKDSDPKKAQAFRSAVITTADYFLGTNALNHTWVTGLGVRHVNFVFHMDAWYNGKPTPHPGIVPYGPWMKNKDLGMGPWDNDWSNKTTYPVIDQWPGNERWFDNRNAPLSGEFTIHQNTCYSAATFGWLCAPAKK
jgi:endoglucanase